ncbi:hypothetical protein Taro_001459 [Colocasia esculenta]|uniref:Uncharacterized protein n=1 Tax=Colocasia esculenta TaxID=4460 RepID=A0A843TKN6_COLES|nr:hypothetical protein [Colocasia esculenta]
MYAACRMLGWLSDVRNGKATPESVATRSRRVGHRVTGVKLFLTLVPWFVMKNMCPRFCVSQARVCARGLSWYSGIVEVLSSSWTPSFSGRVVVRLRERRQRAATLPHFRELGPESLKVPGMGLQGLDLTSVIARLRGSSCTVLSGLDTGVMNQ